MAASPGIADFVRRFDRWHRAASLLTVAFAAAVVSFVAVWIVEVLAPGVAFTARWAGALACAGAVGLGALRGPPRLAAVDRAHGLGDRLRTWAAGGLQAGAMREWFERDLRARLAALPPIFRHRSLRRRLRPLRVLVPVLLALLILRWFAPPSGEGPLSGGGGGAGTIGPEASQGSTPAPGETPSSEQPGAPPLEVTPRPEPDAPPEPEPDAPPQQPEPGDPESLIAPRPFQNDFAVPHFVGEGPSESAPAHVADVGSGDRRPPARPTRREADDPETADPPIEPSDYEQAFERALRGRHIGERERPIVRRYFELVMERRR